MLKKTKIIVAIVFLAGAILVLVFRPEKEVDVPIVENAPKQELDNEEAIKIEIPAMAIEALRKREYPGGDFTIEQNLPNGSNYQQSVVSYQSEGLKIYGLLTIPLAPMPEKGFPTVLFVHGHIPPKIYSTTGSYPSYQAALAKGGFVTFKPDLRGHGKSEGEATGAHFSEKYVVDALHALSYLQNFEKADPERIGYWGHSNGGEMGLRIAVISKDIKAYSFWAGVVGSFVDELETYNEKISFLQDSNPLVEEFGLPSQNPDFWKQIDPYYYLADISAPVEIQHATGDDSVPIELSRRLRDELGNLGKEFEYVEYQGDDHNISANSGLAWSRTINFFKKNL